MYDVCVDLIRKIVMAKERVLIEKKLIDPVFARHSSFLVFVPGF